MQRLTVYARNIVITILTVVLFGNMTFARALDFHFCQEELQSVAFFGKQASCNKMMDAPRKAPMSCCDVNNESEGLSFNEKSCCDNLQFVQENVFVEHSVDIDDLDHFSSDLFNDFLAAVELSKKVDIVEENVEIPPPPNIVKEHSQEKLQVFII